MVEPSRKKQKGSASILHFVVLVKMNQRVIAALNPHTYENKSQIIDDEIFIAEPQPVWYMYKKGVSSIE